MTCIEELDFSVRTYNCLKRAGIDTVELLSKLSDDDLLKLRCFGKKSLAEVRHKVALPRKTNADRIREMNDRELAAVIMCPYGTEPDYCFKTDCVECSRQWLQQPAEVEQ